MRGLRSQKGECQLNRCEELSLEQLERGEYLSILDEITHALYGDVWDAMIQGEPESISTFLFRELPLFVKRLQTLAINVSEVAQARIAEYND
jgi:hypothetical protein